MCRFLNSHKILKFYVFHVDLIHIDRQLLLQHTLSMSEKRTMTLNLSETEMDALESLAQKKDLNKTIIIRQALRLYQMMDQKSREGKKLIIEDETTKDKSELIFV